MPDENYVDNPLDDAAAIAEMDFAIASVLPDKSVASIESESNFNIAPGVYHAYIKRIGVQKNTDTHGDDHFIKVYVDDEETSFVSMKTEIDFALLTCEEGVTPSSLLKGDGEPQTIRAFFVMPPKNPSEMDAYERGYVNRDKPRGAGFFAKQLKQMVGHLSFDDGQGGLLPASNSPGNWYKWDDGTPRFLKLTVQLGAERIKEGRKTQYSEVKMYSYADSDLNGNPPPEFAPKAATRPAPTQPVPSQQPSQAQRPQGQPAQATQQSGQRPVASTANTSGQRPTAAASAGAGQRPGAGVRPGAKVDKHGI